MKFQRGPRIGASPHVNLIKVNESRSAHFLLNKEKQSYQSSARKIFPKEFGSKAISAAFLYYTSDMKMLLKKTTLNHQPKDTVCHKTDYQVTYRVQKCRARWHEVVLVLDSVHSSRPFNSNGLRTKKVPSYIRLGNRSKKMLKIKRLRNLYSKILACQFSLHPFSFFWKKNRFLMIEAFWMLG